MMEREALPRGAARVAGRTRVYAVGDIHGRLDLLDRMLDAIDADIVLHPHQHPRLVFLGDYVDRGPHPASVLHRLVEVTETYEAVCLLGNHEVLLAEFLDDPSTFERWQRVGALTTLMSYGIKPPARPTMEDAAAMSATLGRHILASHRLFLAACPLAAVSGDYLFVHAGIRPTLALSEQVAADLLGIRAEFTDHDGPLEKFVVHGHTPVPVPDVRAHRINIDTGAFATGRLTCLILEGLDRWILRT